MVESVSMENIDGIRFPTSGVKILSDVPFCFTIEAGNGTAGLLAKEIFSSSVLLFEKCARE